MRFVCDSCRAQYMISDDKVGPRGAKVRCKKCGYVILVRRGENLSAPVDEASNTAAPPPAQQEETASGSAASPATGAPGILDGVAEDEIGAVFDQALNPSSGPLSAGSDAGSLPTGSEGQAGEDGFLQARVAVNGAASLDGPAEPDGASHDWFVAIDEKQVGPLALEKLRDLWNRGELGADSLCWRAGLSDWVALSEVAELATVLAPKPVKPVIIAAAPVTAPAASTAAPVESAFSAGSMARASALNSPAAAAAPSSADEPGAWRPSAASALASLMKEEIEVLAKPAAKPAAPAIAQAPGAVVTDMVAPMVNGHEASSPRFKEIADSGSAEEIAPLASSHPYPYGPVGGGRSRRGWIIGLSIFGGVSVLALAVVTTILVLRPEPAASRPPRDGAPPAPPREGAAATAPSGSPPAAAGAPSTIPGQANLPPPAAVKADGTAQPAGAARPEPIAPALTTDGNGAPRERGGTRRERRASHRQPTEEITAPTRAERPAVASAPHNASEDDFDRVFGGAEKRRTAIPKAEPRKPSSVYVPPAPGSSETSDSLGTADIMRVVVDNKPAIKQCVDEQRKRDAGLSGKIVMSWTILSSGKTTSISCASDEFKSSYMAHCMAGLIKGWQFPRHKVQGEPINFPFTF